MQEMLRAGLYILRSDAVVTQGCSITIWQPEMSQFRFSTAAVPGMKSESSPFHLSGSFRRRIYEKPLTLKKNSVE